MERLQEIFSNREIALIFWYVLLILFFLLKGVGNSVLGLLRSFFASQLAIIYLLMTLYTIGLIYILYQVNLWDKNLIKDSLIWFVTFTFANLFKSIKKRNMFEFLETINEIFKLTIFIEFIVNFKSFGLGIELVMLPLITFIGIAQFLSEKEDKIIAKNFFSKTLSHVGIIYLITSLYNSIKEYEIFFSNTNLNSLVLPVLLSFFSLPFFYLLPVYSEYEQLYMRVNFKSRDKKIQRKIKWEIFKCAGLNLDMISKLRDKLISFELYETKDIKVHLNKIKKNCR
ncbi:hypothetical protein GENT5_01190 [Flavobacterium ammoniigenes]|uniref:Uncharacterized protein n=1 Tax=Flavobacterium ammoniigenes TaxID=1751095 RepID=A0ABM7V272_9FLAO|nr:hypothetical protein [Flavobacterium ammoniigenes]BDB53814.1 hypothetical protein GENT5_01190 [Flavobacterium ammoniigenes]